MSKYADLLNRNMDSIEKPKTRPEGLYGAVIAGFDFGESAQKQTPYVRFNYIINQPVEVDEEELAEAGGMPEGGIKAREDYYLTDDAMWRLKEAIVKAGGPESGTIEEGLEAIKGADVHLLMEQVPKRDDPETIFLVVKEMLAAS